MQIAIICFTRRGLDAAERGRKAVENLGYTCSLSCKKQGMPNEIHVSLAEWTAERFRDSAALLFVGAAGIAVRSIAPFLESKCTDPAVLVMDEACRFVIPLLSGHLGGANALALALAKELQAQAVITTATDLNRKFAVDVFAKENGLVLTDMEMAKRVSAAILDGQRIPFYSEYPVEGEPPEELRVSALPFGEELMHFNSPWDGMAPKGSSLSNSPLDGMAPEGSSLSNSPLNDMAPEGSSLSNSPLDDMAPEGSEQSSHPSGIMHAQHPLPSISVSCRAPRNENVLLLVPRTVTLGIGCKKGTAYPKLKSFVEHTLKEQGLLPSAVERICSIDIKKNEEALLQMAQEFGVPFVCFSAGDLMAVPGNFHSSPFVLSHTGADNVCERSAVLGSGGSLILRRTAFDGITLAAAARVITLRFSTR